MLFFQHMHLSSVKRSDTSCEEKKRDRGISSGLSYRRATVSSRAKITTSFAISEDHGSSTQRETSSRKASTTTPRSVREKPMHSSSSSRRHPSSTETRVVRQFDTASREYLNDLNQIHELRLARLNFSDLALADLSSSRRSTESMAKREAITNLSKKTKHTRTILEVLRQEEHAKNRPLKNYRKFEH
ncbi:uncharacterized protein LOC142335205 isoform X2 [Convolutriloba macropyga]|uniref:uncharacterized protein LOC142335205 isoform X2 n=1 Tax=Convolutriloba macropyga TaxID=536237 RepID=UPI003F520C66